MSMQGSEISPEDRERLAKGKFSEWFDENMTNKFGELFDSRLNEIAKAGGKPPVAGQLQSQQTHQESPRQQRRRSLFEQCLSDAIGW